MRSVSLGIWVGTGSRHESAGENGAAHFIEHMLFKGTRSRTAAQLAEEMDAVGGQINAFTTKECTCFYARVLDTHLARAADILCDMFFHSRFDDADVETERGVILEEIGMYEDNPEDLCAERLAGAVFKGSPLARPMALLPTPWPGALRPGGGPTAARAAAYVPGVVVKKKAIEQNHLTLAFPGLSFADPRRFQLQLLSSILGGGVSSRLFQQVREQQGLCYSIYSYGTCHDDTGYFGVYTALGRETEGQALDTISGRDPGADRARRHPGRVGPGPGAVQGQRAHGAGVHPVPHEQLGPGRAAPGRGAGRGRHHRCLRRGDAGGRAGPGRRAVPF